jgi:transposase
MSKSYQNVAAIGLDVAYKCSKVTFRNASGKAIRRERLEHTDREALRRRLAQWPKDAVIVMEASFGWQWLYDEMVAAGLRPRLSNCWKVEKMRKARGWAKTNKKDADLTSLLPFERDNWWEVWAAPPEVRDRREWMRYRADLVAMQTGSKNRIHAVFHRHGIFHDFSDLFGAKGRCFLAELCRDGSGRLSGGALVAFRGQVRLLGQVRGQLAEVTKSLRTNLEHNALTRRLATIPGIGLVLSHVIVAEVGRMERFASDGRLASYALLAPRAADTGEEDPSRAPIGRHLGQRGNRTLKWTFVEAAHGAVRKGGKWRAMFDRYTQGGKKNRNRGYIKVARELAKVVYVVWSRQVDYTDAPPPRPASPAPRAPCGREALEEFFGLAAGGAQRDRKELAEQREPCSEPGSARGKVPMAKTAKTNHRPNARAASAKAKAATAGTARRAQA